MKPPKGLGPDGRDLFVRLMDCYDFTDDPHRVVMAEQACRQLDLIVRLQGDIDSRASLEVRGSAGQPVLAGCVGEVRAARVALAGLLKSLTLPDTAELEERKRVELSLVRSAARKGQSNGRRVSY